MNCLPDQWILKSAGKQHNYQVGQVTLVYNGNIYPYHIAELVRTEKEHSDWLPQQPELPYTDLYDGPLAIVRLTGEKCFNFTKKSKCFKLNL